MSVPINLSMACLPSTSPTQPLHLSYITSGMTYSKPNLSKTEKEEESLEENWFPYLRRYFRRPMFIVEFPSVLIFFYLCAKCMSRLLTGADPDTAEWPWWSALACSGIFTVLEIVYIGSACDAAVGKLVSGENGPGAKAGAKRQQHTVHHYN